MNFLVQLASAVIKFKLKDYQISSYINVNDDAEDSKLILVQIKNHNNSIFLSPEIRADVARTGVRYQRPWILHFQVSLIQCLFWDKSKRKN